MEKAQHTVWHDWMLENYSRNIKWTAISSTTMISYRIELYP